MHNSPRYFRSNEEAFAYACEAMDYAVRDGVVLPALVEDASADFLTPTPVKRKEDGNQVAVLRVPSEDGVIQVIGETATPGAPDLAVGDLVEWRCGVIATGVWIGLILGRLAPELRPDGWRMEQLFTP